MNYSIVFDDSFEKEVKRLSKLYDKSERDSIHLKEIEELLIKNGLK